MISNYEAPMAQIILLSSLTAIAEDEYDPDGPSQVEEGFEKWPED